MRCSKYSERTEDAPWVYKHGFSVPPRFYGPLFRLFTFGSEFSNLCTFFKKGHFTGWNSDMFTFSLCFYTCSPESFQVALGPFAQPINCKGFSLQVAFLCYGLLLCKSLLVNVLYYFVSKFSYPSCIKVPVEYSGSLILITFCLSLELLYSIADIPSGL